MKVEELMIGNYLQTIPFSIPRLQLSSDGVNQITAFGIYIMSSNSEALEQYQPIPLNEEWVKYLGFKEFGNHKYKTYYKDHIFLHKRKRGWVMSKRFKEPKYVHELQNIYFALKGKQLIKK